MNEAFEAAATGSLENILGVTREPLVSVDVNGDPHSAIVDPSTTAVIDGSLIKALAWYDNEWRYSCRVRDLVLYIARTSP